MATNTHAHRWEDEPADKRPSEFSSTGFSALSGFHPPTEPRSRARLAPGFGLASLIATALLLAFCGLSIYWIATWLHV